MATHNPPLQSIYTTSDITAASNSMLTTSPGSASPVHANGAHNYPTTDTNAWRAYPSTSALQQQTHSSSQVTQQTTRVSDQTPSSYPMQYSCSPTYSRISLSGNGFATSQPIPDLGYPSSDMPDPVSSVELELAFANAQIHSPHMMSDDGQNSYSSPITGMDTDTSCYRAPTCQTQPIDQYMDNKDTCTNGEDRLAQSFFSDHLYTQGSTTMQPSSLRLDTSMLGSDAYYQERLSDLGVGNQSSFANVKIPSRSPVLRIDTCEDLPQLSSVHHEVRHSRRRSTIVNGHLSPYIDDDQFSINSLNESLYALSGNSSHSDNDLSLDRNTGGLSPVDREGLNNYEIPSLNEQEKQRGLADKNADIEGWLDISAPVSHTEELYPGLQPQNRNRPRSCSTNDIARLQSLEPPHQSMDQSHVPGTLSDNMGFGWASDMISSNIRVGDETYGTEISDFTIASNQDFQPEAHRRAFHMPHHRLWGVDPSNSIPSFEQSVPGTVNAAITSWHGACAKKEVYEASITATINTLDSARRRSVSDLGSLYSQSGVSRHLHAETVNQKRGITGYLQGMFPTRTTSRNNGKKRKSTLDTDLADASLGTAQQIPATLGEFHSKSPDSRPRTPRTAGRRANSTSGNRSPILAAASSKFTKLRSRSKSELVSSSSPGLMELWKETGGPPVGYLAVPTNNHDTASVASSDTRANDYDVTDDDEATANDLDVKLDMFVEPTYDGFRDQIKLLNPAIDDQLLDRLIKEQVQRYRRLVDAKIDHEKKAQRGRCASHRMCALSGGQPQPIVPKPGAEGSSTPIFLVESDEDLMDRTQTPGDAQIATFRQGVPKPLVQSLPARFECSYCFQAKDIHKPSDWTKHIDEDVQPFTCTFLDCSEPRSFKRKADWVRHEREKHRHPQIWTCNFEDCLHECFRRDNFVQHLVREHSIPDPKIRTGRNNGTRSPAWSPSTPVQFGSLIQYFSNDKEVGIFVNKYVDSCQSLDSADPQTEPCRFCGQTCKSWKDLSVHLARHMEQIAMPVLGLVDRHAGVREPSLAMRQEQSIQQSTEQMMQPGLELSISAEPFLFDEPHAMDLGDSYNNFGRNMQSSSMSSLGNSNQSYTPVNQFGSATNAESYRPITYPIATSDFPSTSEVADSARIDKTHPQLHVWPSSLDGSSSTTMPNMLLSDMNPYNFDSSIAQQQAGHSSQQHEYFTSLNNFGNA